MYYIGVLFFDFFLGGGGGEGVCTLNTSSGIIIILIITYMQTPGSDKRFHVTQLIHIK